MEGKSIKKIGNYQITSTVLGKGTFSTVYLAYDHRQQPIAAKVIALNNLKNDEIDSLERELNILRRCRHENIVTLLDAKKTVNNFYIFLEYCEQGTLDDLIRSRGKLEEAYAISLFSQIMKGMEVINTCKIVHRDIKPANILIHKGFAKIADFGLAKKQPKEQMLQTYAGTPFNMAPEILKGQPYSEKVDVYSLGTVLYEMLFGKSPFEGENIEKLLKAIKSGLKASKSNEISPNIIELIRCMLKPNPEERITMNGILQEMSKYSNGMRQKKLCEYKKLSWRCLSGIGAVGCMIGALGLQNIRKDPLDMDLRLFNKFSQKMAIINLS